MPTADTEPYRPFGHLPEATHARLARFGLQDVPVPPRFVGHTGANGRIRLDAWEWTIGTPALATCRCVRIHGAATDIVNTMIFPQNPAETSCYAAELLTFGRSPKLVFIDLQVPGMPPAAAAPVDARLRTVAARYGELPTGGDCPDWASRYSTGAYIYSRPCDRRWEEPVAQCYLDYLDAWCELAPTAGTPPTASGQTALRDYQIEHLTHTPGTHFLGKVFGDEWALDFMRNWLYRPIHDTASSPQEETSNEHYHQLA